ncbi:Cleavage stimulation factor subunit 1 [Portunus trituberculatus]|uniref:Cleavage stimulation factor subunit 1 n=1 Tax=Portunus trituberculatus TaxID=210409 RepID=A0A5B7E6Y7_PORTR|nr:Cleavage stimulation factor subunit 1 [Portunus trituberculatus]
MVESRVQVVLLACKEDMVSPAILIESADLKIIETVDGVKMVASNAISFLALLMSVNNIQLHFESHNGPVRHMVHSPCSPAFITCSDDYRARFWYRRNKNTVAAAEKFEYLDIEVNSETEAANTSTRSWIQETLTTSEQPPAAKWHS